MQKTVDVPQLQFLTVVAVQLGSSWRFHRCSFGRVVHARACVVRQVPGLGVHKTVEMPQLQFANQLTREKPVEIPQAQFLDAGLSMPTVEVPQSDDECGRGYRVLLAVRGRTRGHAA